MSSELKKATLRALFWSFLERFGQQGLQFVFSIIMARLLLPAEFGLIAMLSIFMAFAQAFINSGFGQALIQKKNATYIDECSIFYFNIFVAFVTAGLVFLAAPWIADFYHQPQLVLMTRVLSVSLIFNSLGLVQRTLLSKRLDFKTQLKVSIFTTLISGTISVTLALNGFGVWSLVVLYLCNDFFNTAFLWFFSPWRPSFIFSFASLQSMFAFGSRLLMVSLSNSIFVNIYQLVIGKFFSASSLGFYSRANSLYKYPVTLLNGVVSQVTFPVFSKIQDDKGRLKGALSKSLKMVMFITFPLMIGLAVVAKPLVITLLTEKWMPSILYLQLLCIIGILYPIQAINLNALNAQGYSNLYLRVDVLNKILVTIIIAITFRWGIIAIIFGQIISNFIAYYLYAYYTGKLLEYTIFDQIKDLFPSLTIAFVMGIFVFSVKYLSFSSQLVLLIVQIIIGIIAYVGMSYLFKLSSFLEVIKLAKMLKFRLVRS